MESGGGGRRRRGRPVPIPNPAAAGAAAADDDAAPSSSMGTSSNTGNGGVLASVWARVADFGAVGPKERAAWHLRRLLEPTLGPATTDVQVVHTVAAPSASGHVALASPRSAGRGPEEARPAPPLLAPSTQVFFLYGSYRVVLCLHVARSLFCFQGELLPVELMESALANALRALMADVGRSDFQGIELHVTVLACDPEHEAVHTLVQGYPLSPQSLPALLQQVGPFLVGIENALAEQSTTHHHRRRPAQDEDDDEINGADNTSVLERLLEASLFALQFLPGHAAPAVLLLTDGIFGLGRAGLAAYDDAAMQLARDDVTLAVATLGQPQDAATALGYLADVEALRVLVESTGGALLGAGHLLGGTSSAAPNKAPGRAFVPPQGPEVVARWAAAQQALGLREPLQAALFVRRSRLNVTAFAAADLLVDGALPVARRSSNTSLALAVSPPAGSLLASTASSSSAPPLARARLKLYALPLVCLRMLVQLRAAEGFQATLLHVSAPPASGLAGPTVLLRMSRYLDRNFAIEYAVEFAPLVVQGGGVRRRRQEQEPPPQQQQQPEDERVDEALGSANVTVALVGTQEWVRAVGASSSSTGGRPSSSGGQHGHQLTSSSRSSAAAAGSGGPGVDALRQALRRFLRALQDVDLGLFRIATLLKPRPPPPSTPSAALSSSSSSGSRRKSSSGESGAADAQREKEVGKFYRELLWLGQLPVREWGRWLTPAYFELLTLAGSGQQGGGDEEEDEEQEAAEEDASPSPRRRARPGHESLGSAPPDGQDEEAREPDGGAPLHVREDLLLTLLGRWCTLRAGRDLFLHVEEAPVAPGGRRREGRLSSSRQRAGQRQSAPDVGRYLRFCLLKLEWASDHVVGLHLGFFGLEPAAIRQQVAALQRALVSADGPLLLPEAPLGYQLVLPRERGGRWRQHGDGDDEADGGSSMLSDDTAGEQPSLTLALVGAPVPNGGGAHPHRGHCQQLSLFPLPATSAANLTRAYLMHRRWEWRLGSYSSAPLVARMLARSQLAAGFRLVHRGAHHTLLVRHEALALTAAGTGAASSSPTRAVLVQYRVLLDEAHGAVVTELWMEPQSGYGGREGAEQHPRPHAAVWEVLASGCYARDRQLVSALDSFFYVRHLCVSAEALPPQQHHMAAEAPADLNLLEVLRGAERTRLQLRFFLPLGPEQQQAQKQQLLPGSPRVESSSAADELALQAGADPDASNRHLHSLALRTLRMLLGAEIPSLDLGGLFGQQSAASSAESREEAKDHGADAGGTAARSPSPPDEQQQAEGPQSSPAASWSEELGLGPVASWRGGKCFAHLLPGDVISVWFMPLYHPCRGGTGAAATVPLLDVTIFLVTSKHLFGRLIQPPPGQQPRVEPTAAPPAGSALLPDTPLLPYIGYLHRRNFTQVAYMALRRGRPVAGADMREALGYCSEIGMDVDLTQLRKIALATADLRRRRREQAMVRFAAWRHRRGSDTSSVATDGTAGPAYRDEEPESDGEEEARDSEEGEGCRGAAPLSKLADREFARTITAFLAPVPGTDFYYFTGTEDDLLEGEDEEEAASFGGLVSPSRGQPALSTAPHKIYLRKASSAATAAAPAALLPSPGPSAGTATAPDALGLNGSAGSADSSAIGVEGEKGIASLFHSGFAAEFSLMLKYIEGKRRARAHRVLSSAAGPAGGQRQETFLTPCFVRFEVVHALFGLAQSRVFRLVGSAAPPSAVLPFCFDEAVAGEDMWVPPRVSRQATAVSIICATHSRLDVGKFEAAVEAARRAGRGGPTTTGGLALDEIKDLMMTTHSRFLRLVRRRVEAWAAAETLRCLLALSPLPNSAVHTVLGCLRPLPPEAITRFQVKLTFVANLPGSREDEDSDEDEGVAPAGKGDRGAPPGAQRAGRPAAKSTAAAAPAPAPGKEGDAGGTEDEDGGGEAQEAGWGMSPLEQHEEAAIALFHEHLASCRFLPVRRVSGVYFVVDPHPGPAQHGGGRPVSATRLSAGRLISSAPSSSGSLAHDPRSMTTAAEAAVLASCDYSVPYWAVLQVRRRRGGRRPSGAAGRGERAGSIRWSGAAAASGPYRRGGGEPVVEVVVPSVVDSFEVEVSFHHPPTAPWYESRERVMDMVRDGLLAACAHVNSLLLLRHLHTTRLASPLLIAPSEADVKYMEETGSGGRGGGSSVERSAGERTTASRGGAAHRRAGEERGSETTPFFPNQFKCPRQLTLRFPVFHRLTPAAAMRALESTVLHPLNVANRLHTFVHRDRHGRVAYLRLESSRRKDSLTSSGHGLHAALHQQQSVVEGVVGDASTPDPQMAPFMSSGGTLYTPLGLGAAGIAPMGPSVIFSASEPPHATMQAGPNAWVDLHVHGVDEVGEEISVQLYRLLESRLAEIAIAQLSELLSRNPRLQLTPQDLDLIKTGTVGAAAIASGFLRGESAASFSLTTTHAAGAGAAAVAPSVPSSAAGAAVGASHHGEAGPSEGNGYRAVLELPGRLLRYGDPYLLLLYLRQNTARAQFINSIHLQGAHGPSLALPASAAHHRSLSRGGDAGHQQYQHDLRAPGAGASSLHSPKVSSEDLAAALGGSAAASSGVGGFGSGRGIPGLTEVWAPEGADATTCHPARIGYTGPRPLEPLSAATSHPAFWSLAGGVEVELDPGLLNLYYNHSRPEVYEAGRKDVASTLSTRGARLAREVGKGLALVNVRPVDASGQVVTRLRSAVSVTQEEVDAVLAAAAESAGTIQQALVQLKQEQQQAAKGAEGESTSAGGSSSATELSGTVAGIPASCLPVPWATSILKSLSVAGGEEGLSPAPTPLTKSNSASHLFEAGEGIGGGDSEGAPGEVWGISVEVMGSVNGQPLMEWLKLCVDQALHDYFVERLLNFLKNPPARSVLAADSPARARARASAGEQGGAAEKRSTLVDRVRRAVRPIDQLVAGSLVLDSPSVRRQATEEVVPPPDVAPLVRVLCRALAQTHPFLQATLTLLHRLPLDAAKGLAALPSASAAASASTSTPKARGLLELVDPRRLVAASAGKGGLGFDEDADRGEYIILCGLRVGDGGADAAGGDKEDALSASTSAAVQTGPGGGGGESRMVRSKSTEMLPPADALYPMLTPAEGATASMAALRMTNRDTACVVRISADQQSLVLYNCHPEFAGRCVAAFQRALALAALERFVAEGIGMQKMGLLPLDMPWWRSVPGLGALLEESKGRLKRLDGQDGAAASDAGPGGSSNSLSRAPSSEGMRLERGLSKTDATAGGVEAEPSSSAASGGREQPAPRAQREASSGPDAPRQAAAGPITPGSGAGLAPVPRKPPAPPIRKPSDSGPGGPGAGGGGSGMVLTPAMAARLRASGRALPLGMKGGPPAAARKLSRAASGGASAAAGAAGAVGGGVVVSPASGLGRTANAGSAARGTGASSSLAGARASTPKTPSAPLSSTGELKRAGGGPAPASTAASSAAGAAATSGALEPGRGKAGEEDWLTAPQQWMAAVLANASPRTLRACRRLSQMLREVLPGVWMLRPFDLAASLAEEAALVNSRGGDPQRVHMVRLWESALAHFQALEGDRRAQALCGKWTWYQHFCFLQRQGAHLQSRVRRPLDLMSPGRQPASSPQVGEAKAVDDEDERVPPPLSSEDMSLLLRRARWHGSWSLVLIQRSFVLPTLRRADSDSALSAAAAAAAVRPLDTGSSGLAAPSPISPVVMVASPTPRPPSRPPSRSGAMTPALERRNLSGYSTSSAATAPDLLRQPSSPQGSVAAIALGGVGFAEESAGASRGLDDSGSGGGGGGVVRARDGPRMMSRANTVSDAHALRQLARKALSPSILGGGAGAAAGVGGSIEAPGALGSGGPDSVGGGGRPPTLAHARSRSGGVAGLVERGGLSALALTSRRRAQTQQQEQGEPQAFRQQQRSPAAPVGSGRGDELLEGEEDDFPFAKAFLDRYVAHLQQALKMVPVPVKGTVSAPADDGGNKGGAGPPSSPSAGAAAPEPARANDAGDWSTFRAYLRRFVALTNTVTLVEVRLSRRRLPTTTSGAAGPGVRRLNSEIRVHLALYTLDVTRRDALLPASSVAGGSAVIPSFSRASSGGGGGGAAAVAAIVPGLPTLQTFAWTLPTGPSDAAVGGGSTSALLGPADPILAARGAAEAGPAAPGAARHGHLQLPQDVALTSAQLELATHVYDFLVEHAMALLFGARRALVSTASGGALALVVDLLSKNPEPPSHSRTAIGVRFLSQPSSADTTAIETPLSLPTSTPAAPAPALLAFLQARAADYRLWPLEEVDRDEGLPRGGGVVGALSLTTWRPLDPAARATAAVPAGADRGDEEMLVFVMTLADDRDDLDGSRHSQRSAASAGDGAGEREEEEGGETAAEADAEGGEFRLLIMHRKGKERGQRGSYMEIPGRVKRLLLRTLGEAAFDHAKARIWRRVQACLAEKAASDPTAWAHDASPSSAGVPLAAPQPVAAHGGSSARGAGLAPHATTAHEDVSALAPALPPTGLPHAPFRVQELAALLHFSTATPLAALDKALAPLLGCGGHDGEKLEGLPWLDILTHLERAFWRRAVAVEGLRSGPGEADLLISCHDAGSEEEQAAEQQQQQRGHAHASAGRRPVASSSSIASGGGSGSGGGGGAPPLPRVLLHLSVRPPPEQGEDEAAAAVVDAASPSSEPRPRSSVRAQLLVRTGRREEEKGTGLGPGERRQVEAVVGHILGYLWLKVLGRAPAAAPPAAPSSGAGGGGGGSFFTGRGGGSGGSVGMGGIGGPSWVSTSTRSLSARLG